MKKILLFSSIVLFSFLYSCGDGKTYGTIETEFGTMKFMLYDETPIHKENFIKLANEGFYDDLLFHRVIKNFMIQGGDPESKGAPSGKMLGNGGPGYTLPNEIGYPHFKGALASARNNNPEKRSNGSQFYIVHGKKINDHLLNSAEKMSGFTYSPIQRDYYKEVGGSPELDGKYTVFGEVIEGWDVIDKIVEVAKNPQNRPNEDVKMKVRIQ